MTSFSDWAADVADVVRDQMSGLELDDLSTYSEDEAKMYWAEGYTAKRFFREVLTQEDADPTGEDDFDPRFDL